MLILHFVTAIPATMSGVFADFLWSMPNQMQNAPRSLRCLGKHLDWTVRLGKINRPTSLFTFQGNFRSVKFSQMQFITDNGAHPFKANYSSLLLDIGSMSVFHSVRPSWVSNKFH